jgi:hypothetical protein
MTVWNSEAVGMKSETFRKLAALGLSHEQMAGVLEAFEGEMSVRDDADEDRRAKGRERWRKWKENKGSNVSKREQTLANNSCGGDTRGDVKQNNLEIPNSKKEEKADKPLSDLSAFKAELSPLLSAERVTSIVDQRRKKKAPINANTGRLLAKAIQKCPDADEAVDEMILRNWTTVKPEWLSTGNQRGQPPPKPKSEFMQTQHDIREQLRRENGEHHDEFAGNTIELTERDFRHH